MSRKDGEEGAGLPSRKGFIHLDRRAPQASPCPDQDPPPPALLPTPLPYDTEAPPVPNVSPGPIKMSGAD